MRPSDRDPCKHECRTEAGGIVGCALERGHALPHESESGHKWVTAQWGPGPHCKRCSGTGRVEIEGSSWFCADCLGTGRSKAKPECARCAELAGHLETALARIHELEQGMP